MYLEACTIVMELHPFYVQVFNVFTETTNIASIVVSQIFQVEVSISKHFVDCPWALIQAYEYARWCMDAQPKLPDGNPVRQN